MADAPRLFLITPPLDDAAAFVPLLQSALEAGDVACLLVRTASADEHALKAAVRVLAPVAQARDVAVLIEGEPRLAARLGVDGVHVAGGGAPLDDAIDSLHPDRIVGTGGLSGRDAAMAAGESGVDYLMFGAPDAGESQGSILDQVAWWAEIFNVPCVGYAVHPDHAGEVAAAGAEFVGLCEGLWERPEAIAARLAEVMHAVQVAPEDVL